MSDWTVWQQCYKVLLWLCWHDGVKFWLQAGRDLKDLWTVVWWRGGVILSGGLMIGSSADDMLPTWKCLRLELCPQVEDHTTGLEFRKSFTSLKLYFVRLLSGRLLGCKCVCVWEMCHDESLTWWTQTGWICFFVVHTGIIVMCSWATVVSVSINEPVIKWNTLLFQMQNFTEVCLSAVRVVHRNMMTVQLLHFESEIDAVWMKMCPCNLGNVHSLTSDHTWWFNSWFNAIRCACVIKILNNWSFP